MNGCTLVFYFASLEGGLEGSICDVTALFGCGLMSVTPGRLPIWVTNLIIAAFFVWRGSYQCDCCSHCETVWVDCMCGGSLPDYGKKRGMDSIYHL